MPLNHTAALFAIATPHFERLVDFYKALLTQEPTAYTPNVYAEFQLPGVKLGIYRPKVEFGVTPTLREAKATETLRERSLEFGEIDYTRNPSQCAIAAYCGLYKERLQHIYTHNTYGITTTWF